MLSVTSALIEVEGIGKLHSRSTASARRRAAGMLGNVLLGRRNPVMPEPRDGEFWAVKNVTFRMERGEALGIIGLNGSGKTTLLRILAGQILPDEGEIRQYGSVASLIDASAGFRMNATGRENIYLKGAMLGRSRAEMDALYDEIVAFTELGNAIGAPISTYSSGMLMRLAFAVNTASSPDILLIDETLSVGDFRFRQKCLARLRAIRERTCFILVSHSMGDIKRFCTRAIVLSKGRVAFEGKPDDAITFYETMEAESQTPEKRIEAILKPWHFNADAVSDFEHYWCDRDGHAVSEVRSGDPLFFHVAFTPSYAPRNLILGVPVWTESGQYVTGFSTEIGTQKFGIEAGQRAVFRLEVPSLPFNPGTYISNIAVHDGPEYLVRADNPILTVRAKIRHFWGVVSIPHSWQRTDQPGEVPQKQETIE